MLSKKINAFLPNAPKVFNHIVPGVIYINFFFYSFGTILIIKEIFFFYYSINS